MAQMEQEYWILHKLRLQSGIWLKCPLSGVCWACPTSRRPRSRPRQHRNSMNQQKQSEGKTQRSSTFKLKQEIQRKHLQSNKLHKLGRPRTNKHKANKHKGINNNILNIFQKSKTITWQVIFAASHVSVLIFQCSPDRKHHTSGNLC